MESDFLGNTLNVEKESGGEVDYSLAIDGVISVSCVDGFLQPCSRKRMFSDKPPIKAGDTCATINECASVNGFQGVRWFDKLNWNLD